MFDFITKILAYPFTFLDEILVRGGKRTHALVTILTCVTLCWCTIKLSYASYHGRQVVAELGIVVGALSSLVAYVYRKGKEHGQAEAQKGGAV